MRDLRAANEALKSRFDDMKAKHEKFVAEEHQAVVDQLKDKESKMLPLE